ncbi:hypothetical protein [Sphingomonas sp.]|uniref:hypothetical protein n=1 Tax=Sphingomonas sp. TaxID=28214 RepID=UPI0025DB40BA|nr:hypothetical protein [Sphingomonas sp.]
MSSHPGLDPLTPAPPLDGVEGEARIQAMVDWFFENFEDPAEETPYNGREGGYLYIYGGPFEAQDYIPDAFPDATEEEQIEAIDRIDADGPDFAPAGARIRYPEEQDDFDGPPPPTLDERLNALAGQLDTIEAHVAQILTIQRGDGLDDLQEEPGIGHNNPPPEIAEDEPDLRDVLASIQQIRDELAKPNFAQEASEKVVEVAEDRFRRFVEWVKELAKKSPMLLASGAVTAAGAKLFNYMTGHQAEIVSVGSEIVSTLGSWAANIGFPF